MTFHCSLIEKLLIDVFGFYLVSWSFGPLSYTFLNEEKRQRKQQTRWFEGKNKILCLDVKTPGQWVYNGCDLWRKSWTEIEKWHSPSSTRERTSIVVENYIKVIMGQLVWRRDNDASQTLLKTILHLPSHMKMLIYRFDSDLVEQRFYQHPYLYLLRAFFFLVGF